MSVVLIVALPFVWAMPVFLAKQFADPIDLRPYFEGFGAGLVLGVALSRGLVILARRGFPGLTSVRVGPWVLAIIVLAPTWTVGGALGINRGLDHSAATNHETRTLAWEVPTKSRARCRVTSWRGHASEVVSDNLVMAAEATTPERPVSQAPATNGITKPHWPYPRACVPGTPLIVASHPGALGWEWIESVRAP